MSKFAPSENFGCSTRFDRTSEAAFHRRKQAIGLAAALGVACVGGVAEAQLSLSGSSYDQPFDALGTGLPTGWTVRTAASATSLGSAVAFTTTATAWSSTTGAFANYAAADNAGFTGAETATAQNAATDRALAVRQTGSFGDPGAAFTLQLLNTVDLSAFSMSFSEQMLSVQTRSTSWTVQYGLGSAPTTFTNLGTAYIDPGTFGSTAFTLTGSALDAIANQSQNVWIRIVALTASTASGSRDTFGIDDFHLGWTTAPIISDYWDPNGNATGIGGSGIWDTTTANWNSDPAGTTATTVFSPTHVAIFGGATNPSVVTVASGVTANKGLQFDSNGYTLTGGDLTLGGNPKITVTNAGDTASILTQLLGALGLFKDGAGTLELKNATNNYSGGTTITAGTLVITADGQLGAPTSGVSLAGGILKTTGDLELLAGRAFAGTGTIDVAPASTLKIDGAVSGLTVTLSNTGSVTFAGTAPTLGGLTLDHVVNVTATGGTLGIVGNLTTKNTAGTMTFADTLDFGSVASAIRVINVTDGADPVDLLLNGPVKIAGSSARISKLGAGTLELASSSNSLSGGVRLGEAGLPAVDGGTLRIHSATALGAGIFQANAGTLEVLANLTGANAPAAAVGLSIGGNETSPAIIQGQDIEFPGASSLFVGGSTAYKHKLIANSNVILGGNLTGSFPTSLGFLIAGTGSLTLNGAANSNLSALTVDGATLVMNGNLTVTGTTAKPNTTLLNNATLRGVGTLFAVDVTSGTVAPGKLSGQPTGTLTSTDFNLTSGAHLVLDIRGSAAGNYDRVLATSSLALNGDLTGTVTADAAFNTGDLFFILINGSADDTFGTFTGLADNPVTPSLVVFTGGPTGTTPFEVSYHGDSVGGAFTGGNDVVLRALITIAVPEPASLGLLLAGAGLLGLRRRRGA